MLYCFTAWLRLLLNITQDTNTTNMDIHTSALPASPSPSENTIDTQNSNNYTITTPFQLNFPYATGTPRTTSTTTAPFTFPITTPMIKHGHTNTCGSKNGNLHSIGPISKDTSNSKPQVGNFQNIAPLSHGCPLTNVSSNGSVDDNTPSGNLTFTQVNAYTPLQFYASSASIHFHLFKHQQPSAAANTLILKFTLSVEWPPA